MSWNNAQSVPFWDFIRSLDASGRSGAGVDHPASFEHGGPPPPPPPQAPNAQAQPVFAGPFGGSFTGHFPQGFFNNGYHGHHGHHGFERGSFRGRGGCGPRGRHCRRPEDPEKSGDDNEKAADSETEKGGDQDANGPSNADEGFEGHRGPWEGRRGGGRRHGGGHRHRGPPPPPYGPEGNFDLSGLMNAFSSHPIAQALRNFAEQAQDQTRSATADTDPANTFIPPIDIFSTPTAYILHISLPGAKKEDVGVNWDAEKSELNVAGVVYRQGDEEFLKTLSKSERKVGVFERSVKLPPATEEKEEVDGDAITAKLEDGVLVVNVPKIEKDWTEVKKVDIE